MPSLRDLYEAESLAQLRDRLSNHLVALGFWGVGESINPKPYREFIPGNLRICPWDNFASRVGENRRQDLHRAHHEACFALGEVEENRRLKWLAAHKRPSFAITNASTRFEAHHDRCRVDRDFRLRTVDHLVLPISPIGSAPRRLWTIAETCSALQSAGDVVGLLTVYRYMSRMLDLGEGPDANGGEPADGSRAGPGTGQRANPGAATAAIADTGTDKPVALKAVERDVLRWAAAGKTLEEVAIVTGLPYRTVRYHMDSARNRYGFATMQQTIVRAALDYGFDPMGR